jgi:hypothetical protein
VSSISIHLPRAEEEVPLPLQRRHAREPLRAEQSGDRDRGGALHVVVERGDAGGAQARQQLKRLRRPQVLPVDERRRAPALLQRGDQLLRIVCLFVVAVVRCEPKKEPFY